MECFCLFWFSSSRSHAVRTAERHSQFVNSSKSTFFSGIFLLWQQSLAHCQGEMQPSSYQKKGEISSDIIYVSPKALIYHCQVLNIFISPHTTYCYPVHILSTLPIITVINPWVCSCLYRMRFMPIIQLKIKETWLEKCIKLKITITVFIYMHKNSRFQVP